MDHNNSALTDAQLRELLNEVLLSGPDQDLNKKLMDMEANLVFTNEPVLEPAHEFSARMINELHRGFAGKVMQRWIFTTIAAIGIAGAAIWYTGKPATQQQAAMPVSQDAASLHQTPPTPPDPGKPQQPMSAAIPVVPEPDRKVVQQTEETAGQPESVVHSTDPAAPEPVQSEEVLAPIKPAPDFFANESWARRVPVADDERIRDIAVDTIFEGIRKIEVEGLICDIKVRGAEQGHVHLQGDIKVEVKKKSSPAPDYKITTERDGERLIVKVIKTGKTKFTSGFTNIRIDGFLNFTVPVQTSVVLGNSSGNIEVHQLEGQICKIESHYGSVKADSIATGMDIIAHSGDISLNRITGQIDAQSVYGNVAIRNLSGKSVVSASSGNVAMENIQGEVKISAKYGDVSMEEVNGSVTVSSSSGDVRVSKMKGEFCNIDCHYGDVRLRNIEAQSDVDARSGDVHLEQVAGNVKIVSLYGKQQLSGIDGDISINASSGDTELETAKGRVQVKSLYGDIRVNECSGNMILEAESGNIKAKRVYIPDSVSLKAGYGNIQVALKNQSSELSYQLKADYGSIDIEPEGLHSKPEKGSVVINRGRVMVKAYSRSGSVVFE